MSKTKNQSQASMDNIYSLDGKVPLLQSILFSALEASACVIINLDQVDA